MKKVVLKIDGMHCNGCSERLEKALSKKDGIINVKVSFKDKIASIEYDKVNINNIEEYIEDIGFKSLGEV